MSFGVEIRETNKQKSEINAQNATNNNSFFENGQEDGGNNETNRENNKYFGYATR